ncbi:uncharacterized protein LOC116196998 [Punica granatum]|uniref:Uncharacterized protein LOC116196998 n=2 Tax=Punica granatum TaxID=22663 RepID=A0A6P8CKB0_PUNGR|nr:uncharacterized protein LOC116196998 [Punica granatum]
MLDGSLTLTMYLNATGATCSPLLAGKTNKRMSLCLARSSPPEDLRLSSISTSTTDESLNILESRKSSGRKRSPRSNTLLSPGKTVGIIGGASVFSTLVFLEKIVWWSSRDGEEAIPFVVCNDPQLSRELASLSTLRRDSNSISDLNPIGIIENLRGKRSFLKKAGAGCIVMPCHLLHVWHKEVAQGCKLPFLHAGECLSWELKRANLKPLEAGSNVRVGILGTDSILMARTYQENLERQGFEAVLPDKATMEHLVIPAIEALQRKDIEGARNLLRIAIQDLLIRAVKVVILASDEMQGILPRDDPLLKKCIDPMDSLVRSTIEWAKRKEKFHEETGT